MIKLKVLLLSVEAITRQIDVDLFEKVLTY